MLTVGVLAVNGYAVTGGISHGDDGKEAVFILAVTVLFFFRY